MVIEILNFSMPVQIRKTAVVTLIKFWTKMGGSVLTRGKLKGLLFLIFGLYLRQGKIWRWKLVQGLYKEG